VGKWSCAAGVVALLLAALVGCGGATNRAPIRAQNAEPTAVTTAIRRLGRAGYFVRRDLSAPLVRPAPKEGFSVHDVDYATRHAFSVAVYVFGSAPAATRFANAVPSVLRPFVRWPSPGFRVRAVGASVFLGFTQLNIDCPKLGLCGAFPTYGPRCGGSPHHMICPPPQTLPMTDFEKLISVAHGSR
jgi:hypothetical protein